MKRTLKDQINILLLLGGNLEIPNIHVLTFFCGFREEIQLCVSQNDIRLFEDCSYVLSRMKRFGVLLCT